jgi:membrane fusion protein (multidrug efflux system)
MTTSIRCSAVFLVATLFAVYVAGGSVLAQPRVQVQTQPLAEHKLKETVVAYGQVQADPEHISSISLPRAGTINRLVVRLGQRVTKNQELLELDTAPQARMDYQQAKAAVDYARNKLQQTESLFSQQLATRDQVAAARRDLSDAEAKLTALLKLGNQKTMTVIRAPFAGIVTELKVSQGQRVQADTGAMLLASGDTLVVPLGTEPEDARRIAPGMNVVLESLFEQQWRVEVQVTAVLAMVNPDTRLVDVLTRVPASQSAPLVLGNRIKGTITIKEEKHLAVPRSAVLKDAQGAYLFVVRNSRARRVAVTTGLEEGSLVAVAGPLKTGDKVVVVGNYELKDGMAVQEGQP